MRKQRQKKLFLKNMYRQNKLLKIYMFFHIYICIYCYKMEATMELTHIQREKNIP